MAIKIQPALKDCALFRCARLCPCQPITSLWAAAWPRCTCAQMEPTCTGSGPQLVSMRRHRKAILSSWMSFTCLWVLYATQYSSFSCVLFTLFMAVFYLYWFLHPCPWCRRRQGCVLQTSCRRGLFLLARKASLQSAWMSFSWVECHASEPPILPHWLLLQAPLSPTLSKRNSLVIYQQTFIVIQKSQCAIHVAHMVINDSLVTVLF